MSLAADAFWQRRQDDLQNAIDTLLMPGLSDSRTASPTDSDFSQPDSTFSRPGSTRPGPLVRRSSSIYSAASTIYSVSDEYDYDIDVDQVQRMKSIKSLRRRSSSVLPFPPKLVVDTSCTISPSIVDIAGGGGGSHVGNSLAKYARAPPAYPPPPVPSSAATNSASDLNEPFDHQHEEVANSTGFSSSSPYRPMARAGHSSMLITDQDVRRMNGPASPTWQSVFEADSPASGSAVRSPLRRLAVAENRLSGGLQRNRSRGPRRSSALLERRGAIRPKQPNKDRRSTSFAAEGAAPQLAPLVGLHRKFSWEES